MATFYGYRGVICDYSDNVKYWTPRLALELGCPLVSSREAKVAVHFRERYRVSDIFVTKGALGERIEHF